MTGEKRTNPIDQLGKMKMLVGSGVEHQLVKEYLSDLHWYGVHQIGTQVPVGGSNPPIDGNMDAVLVQKTAEGFAEPYVVEIKTKSGYGADLLWSNPTPSPNYLAQIGVYLEDLSNKEITNKGCLLYILLSDKHFGEVIQIDCEYAKETRELVAKQAIYSHGESRELNIRQSMQDVCERIRSVEVSVKEGKVPPPDYIYKFPLTEELLETQSDYNLRAMLDGTKILGDWEPRYSGYLTKNLELDKVSRSYSSEELAMIRREYLKRHPKSKK